MGLSSLLFRGHGLRNATRNCVLSSNNSSSLLCRSMSSGMDAKAAALAEGILSGNRAALARSITLIESTRRDHSAQAAYLLKYLAEQKRFNVEDTLRIGVAGPPGAGKSTFIEQLGMSWIKQGSRVAVIPVDPSSHISGGSILGDKTRMDQLSRSEDAYVRASPTSGKLGGIAEHTSDVIQLCEAAGYDRVIVESVGLGQSEVDIDAAVDMLILLVPPGGGDGLQAAKKGIMEAADLIVVNKADGDFMTNARHTKADYGGAMQFVRQKHQDWRAKVCMASARTGFEMETVENNILGFYDIMKKNGNLRGKRATQSMHWMIGHFRKLVLDHVEHTREVQQGVKVLSEKIHDGEISSRAAATALFDATGLTAAAEDGEQ